MKSFQTVNKRIKILKKTLDELRTEGNKILIDNYTKQLIQLIELKGSNKGYLELRYEEDPKLAILR